MKSWFVSFNRKYEFCKKHEIDFLCFLREINSFFAKLFLLNWLTQNQFQCVIFSCSTDQNFLKKKSAKFDLYLCQKVCKPKRSNFAGYALLSLSAWKFILEAIPQLVINWCYISRQEEIPILSILSAVASGGSILFFFVTLSCKLKAADYEDLQEMD